MFGDYEKNFVRLKSHVLFLMQIPHAFAVARGIIRVAIGAGMQGELLPGALCTSHQVTPGLGALFGTENRSG